MRNGSFCPWLLRSGVLLFEEFRRKNPELLGKTFGEIGRRTETGKKSDFGNAVSAFNDHPFRLVQTNEFHKIVWRQARNGFQFSENQRAAHRQLTSKKSHGQIRIPHMGDDHVAAFKDELFVQPVLLRTRIEFGHEFACIEAPDFITRTKQAGNLRFELVRRERFLDIGVSAAFETLDFRAYASPSRE